MLDFGEHPLEDDILVTDDGPEVLTADVPVQR
jgi:Xaa-Pro aminopeptidase